VDSAGRMDNLITDTLNYSKIMRQELELGPVDATALLHGMVESYSQFQPPKADIHIKSHIPLILANEAGLTQCFSNLLGNAVKFVHPDRIPRVQVRAEDRGQYVRLWFEDNGIGIPKQYHEQIFIMFQRLSKTYEGTGIGLALVRKTVERMKGKIGVESEPGQGSRFWMELERCV
jgi:signal transduction histidine kinase